MNGEHDEQQAAGVFATAQEEARREYKDMDLKSMVEYMAAYRAKKAKAVEALAVANAHFDVLRMELIPNKMDEMGVERIAYEGIGRVSLTADVLVSTKTGMRENLFGWLKKRKLNSLIQPSINPSTLKAFVKDRLAKGKEVPSEYLNVTHITRASITKSA